MIAAQNQSPALAALDEKLSGLADHLADEYLILLEKDDRAALYLYGEAQKQGVDISSSETLRGTIIEIVGERLEAHDLDMEFHNGDLIITRAPEMAEPGMTNGPEMTPQL